tara:strand:+ start:1247 stop:1651 length:405 start_codon:yes stop_codon:yes gene_type:complete
MKTTKKITVNDIIQWELEALKDAIGCELTLHNDMLENSCSEELKELLKPLSESDRNFLIQDHILHGKELNIFGDNGDIKLVIGEIESQFEDPLNDLEDPDDHTINGDLVYTRFEGASFNVDLKGLKEAIDIHAS